MEHASPSVAVVGAGAIGGVTAAFMTEEGWNPILVCKHDDTTSKAQTEGLSVSGLYGDRHIRVNAVNDISDLPGTMDYIFLAMKAVDVLDAADQARTVMGPSSVVVTMQNGVCEDAVADIVGRGAVIGCVVVWGATMKGPGKLEITSPGEFVIGSLDNPKDERLVKIREMLPSVFPTRISENFMGELYSKLVINSCINSLGAITGSPLGELLNNAKVRAVFFELMREMMQVADAMGVRVEPGSGGKLDYYRLLQGHGFFARMKRNFVLRIAGLKYGRIKSSSLQSLERGRKTEIDFLNGYICKQGRALGVPTPLNDAVTALIKEIEAGKRKISWENMKDPVFDPFE